MSFMPEQVATTMPGMALALSTVMRLSRSLFVVLIGCGSPRAERVPPPPLGVSTAPGPSDPTVPPPDSDQMVPEKATRTSIRDTEDAGVTDGAILPPSDAGVGSDAGTGSGTDTGRDKKRPMK
jgi:hypothetical protein